MFRLEQLTFGDYGHTLNRRQVLSHDGQWAVYDTRNDDTHIARTNAIEMVHIESNEIVRLYQTGSSSLFGPGVGAAAFHPTQPTAIFIHGVPGCSESNPYSAARRFGALVDVDSLGKIRAAESRCDCPAYGLDRSAIGVLHGGTHAHSWNARGWISFTYNDAWLERNAKEPSKLRDQRTVGFMLPKLAGSRHSLSHENANGECFDGQYDAFLAASLCQVARPDSDDIEQAVEECWLGHQSAIAFLGSVRDHHGELRQEIFVTDLPDTNAIQEKVGTRYELNAESRLAMAEGCKQRRLTHTLARKHAGIQGPRSWLVASPDGNWIYTLMKDDLGIVQMVRIPTSTGEPEQVTELEHSIEGQLSLGPGGKECAFLCDQRVCLVSVDSGKHEWLTDRSEWTLVGAVHFAGQNRWLCNAYVGPKDHRYLQIFCIE